MVRARWRQNLLSKFWVESWKNERGEDFGDGLRCVEPTRWSYVARLIFQSFLVDDGDAIVFKRMALWEEGEGGKVVYHRFRHLFVLFFKGVWREAQWWWWWSLVYSDDSTDCHRWLDDEWIAFLRSVSILSFSFVFSLRCGVAVLRHFEWRCIYLIGREMLDACPPSPYPPPPLPV